MTAYEALHWRKNHDAWPERRKGRSLEQETAFGKREQTKNV
jgi:hypothetical protein